MDVEQLDLGDVVISAALAGPRDGPLVLAQHGFPDSRETWAPIVPALTAAGYRVVMPTLRGYAPSGVAHSGRHHAVAAGEDLVALAERLSPRAPVRLVGHDWGALAAFVAVSRAPERFCRLATLSVPHPGALLSRVRPAQLRRSWYMALFQLPRIAEARLTADDFALIDRLWRDWSPGHRASPEALRVIKDGIRDRVGPVLAYYRALTSPTVQREARPAHGPVTVPAIHLHGEDDGCVGVECADGAEAYYRAGYALHRVPGAGHFLVQERPDVIAAHLLAHWA